MIRFRSEQSSALLLALLLATDVVLIAFLILQRYGWVADEGWLLNQDRSYGEVLQYVKQFWVVLLLATLAWRGRSLFCAVAAVLFSYFLIDDYAELHETMGQRLAERFELPTFSGVESYHVGELAVFGVYGIVALGLVIVAFPKSQGPQRQLAAHLVGLLALMALFGVGFDALHALPLSLPQLVIDAIGAIEDGGEMIVMSLILWRLFDEVVRCKNSGESAW